MKIFCGCCEYCFLLLYFLIRFQIFSFLKRGNIENADFEKAEELVKYQAPLPMRGSGWHRCAFVLYEHDAKINLKEEFIQKTFAEMNQHASKGDALSRVLRDFNNFDFYMTTKKRQQNLTPIGVKFFQVEWEKTVRDVYHNELDLK